VAKDKAAGKPSGTAIKPTDAQIAKVVETTKNRAEAYARDPEKAKKLLDDAVKKATAFEQNRGPFDETWSYLTTLFRLFRAYTRGQYRQIPWGSIVLVAVGLIYFVWPADLVPDILPGGLVDDAGVIGFVIVQIRADLDNFLGWEISQA